MVSLAAEAKRPNTKTVDSNLNSFDRFFQRDTNSPVSAVDTIKTHPVSVCSHL